MEITLPTIADLERLNNLTVPIFINGVDMFYLVSGLHLLLRHPELPNYHDIYMTVDCFCKALEERLIECAPSAKELLAAGRNPEISTK